MSHESSSVLTGFRREDNANLAFLRSGFSPGSFMQDKVPVVLVAFVIGKLFLIALVISMAFWA